jgi:hypothetical protein
MVSINAKQFMSSGSDHDGSSLDPIFITTSQVKTVQKEL